MKGYAPGSNYLNQNFKYVDFSINPYLKIPMMKFYAQGSNDLN